MTIPETGPLTPLPRRASRFADLAVTIMVTGTLVLFLALVALVIFLVVRVDGVASANNGLVRQVQAAQKATAAIQAAENGNAVAACELANANRTEDVQIIDDILALPAIAAPQYITPAARTAQAAALVRLMPKVRVAYVLRNCSQLYSPTKK